MCLHGPLVRLADFTWQCDALGLWGHGAVGSRGCVRAPPPNAHVTHPSALRLGILQAVVEYNCFVQEDIIDTDEHLRRFRQFWDSEVPRVGEDGATGWANTDLPTAMAQGRPPQPSWMSYARGADAEDEGARFAGPCGCLWRVPPPVEREDHRRSSQVGLGEGRPGRA